MCGTGQRDSAIDILCSVNQFCLAPAQANADNKLRQRPARLREYRRASVILRRCSLSLFVISGLLCSISCKTERHESRAQDTSRLAAIRLRQKARERLAYGWHQLTILHLDSDEEYATVALLGYNRINAVERVQIRKAKEDYRWGRENEELVGTPIPSLVLDPAQAASERLAEIASVETAQSLIMQADRQIDPSGSLEGTDRMRAIASAQARHLILKSQYACTLQELAKSGFLVDEALGKGKDDNFSFSVFCAPVTPNNKSHLRFQAVANPAKPGYRCLCEDESGGVYESAGDLNACLTARHPVDNIHF